MGEKGDFSEKMRELKQSKGKLGGAAKAGKPGLRKVSSSEPAYLAEHKVASGETLSHIATKYYESAAREKWMAIYEANKDVIGDNPSLIRVGQMLKIPKLAD